MVKRLNNQEKIIKILETALLIHISKYLWSLIFSKYCMKILKLILLSWKIFSLKFLFYKSKACSSSLLRYKIKSSFLFTDKKITRDIQF